MPQSKPMQCPGGLSVPSELGFILEVFSQLSDSVISGKTPGGTAEEALKAPTAGNPQR